MTRGIGLYVHIPFCASRCPYCDFATAPATTALRSRYLDALGREIAREGALLGRPRARTLFFGGGTPSLLEPAEIEMLGEALRRAFVLRPREVTLEANPATLDRARLEAWLALGLTRLSLGAQSFDARGLRALGRTHQPEDSATASGSAWEPAHTRISRACGQRTRPTSVRTSRGQSREASEWSTPKPIRRARPRCSRCDWTPASTSSVTRRGSAPPRPHECGPPSVRSSPRILWR